MIRAAGDATPAGVLIALDRHGTRAGRIVGVQEVQRDYGIPVVAVAGLKDLMTLSWLNVPTLPPIAKPSPAIASRYGLMRKHRWLPPGAVGVRGRAGGQ